jgi:3D (Asp-Asp-Asp) domain-containing protein
MAIINRQSNPFLPSSDAGDGFESAVRVLILASAFAIIISQFTIYNPPALLSAPSAWCSDVALVNNPGGGYTAGAQSSKFSAPKLRTQNLELKTQNYLSAVAGNESRMISSSAVRSVPSFPAASLFLPQSDTEGTEIRKMKVTAYCACPKCCGRFADGVTASGHRIKPGDHFAAADKFIPFGTMVIVPGYNGGQPVEVKDRGKAITADRLDVYFESHARARAWGVRILDCKFPIE